MTMMGERMALVMALNNTSSSDHWSGVESLMSSGSHFSGCEMNSGSGGYAFMRDTAVERSSEWRVVL